MQVKDIAQKLSLTLLAGEEGCGREVTGCHIGDLLSLVMSKAQSGDAWITIQGNINVPAVASLTDVSMVIIAENMKPDEQTVKRAETEGIPLFLSEKSAFELACMVEKCL